MLGSMKDYVNIVKGWNRIYVFVRSPFFSADVEVAK